MPYAASPRSSNAPLAALVLQGGGALGAYQAGAYEALALRAQALDWVAGISIGAINAALIAGNPPGRRVAAVAHTPEEHEHGVQCGLAYTRPHRDGWRGPRKRRECMHGHARQ